ncbi:Sec14p-like phosphatidylinositol transfer family protein [Rhynchospora pubera]|uniref:Sec14p-like phosphatidylinositol transfer family protein n=1 Tax=Rhynchospora pubera TaxID=906938 RepID=A0AAV8BS77_9POAL|nr:Sec14p-like phosphatidylinositol transfer family protein [Rhynchospora pubera]
MGTVDVETEWFLIAKMRAFVETQDPSAKETDNFTLRRFLRARDLDIEKGSSLFLKYLKWRRQTVPNGFISESEIQNDLSQRKVFMQGFDKARRPILVCFLAKHDYSKRNMEEFKRFVTYALDKACARMPSGQEKFICIADLKGWTYGHCDIRAYIASLETMQSYYPERLGKALLINVPGIFMKAWKIIYPFIDKNTKEKFIFVDNKKLQEALLEDIHESQLPEIYGGNLPVVPIENA